MVGPFKVFDHYPATMALFRCENIIRAALEVVVKDFLERIKNSGKISLNLYRWLLHFDKVIIIESPLYSLPAATFFPMHHPDMMQIHAARHCKFAVKVLLLVISRRHTDSSLNNFLRQVCWSRLVLSENAQS